MAQFVSMASMPSQNETFSRIECPLSKAVSKTHFNVSEKSPIHNEWSFSKVFIFCLPFSLLVTVTV